ncbi:MAG: alpha/beta hydrolase [Bacilli bacterium]|nr:alpha/beta hydrolase [Bacilli bacterium]
MEMIIKNTSINYVFYENKSKESLVFLHGWGQNIEMMMGLAKPFVKKYNVLILDLPGFGSSAEPDNVWSIYDYAEMLDLVLKELKIKNPILIGHSFGGKISLCYAIKYNPKKIVLLASPFKKKIKKETFKVKVYKFIKKIPGLNKLENFVKKHVGSTDYKNASEKMRKILVNHVNLDLTSELSKIKCPTLLIWGTNDEAVPIEDGQELEKLINNAGLVVYEGCTHYAYLERLDQTIKVLNSFIGSDKK